MPNSQTAQSHLQSHTHGELTCEDVEALLADATAENQRIANENARLVATVEDLNRRLDEANRVKRLAHAHATSRTIDILHAD